MDVKLTLRVAVRNAGATPLIVRRGPLLMLSTSVTVPGVGVFDVPMYDPAVPGPEAFEDPTRGAIEPKRRDFTTIPVGGETVLTTVAGIPWVAEFGTAGDVLLAFHLQTWSNTLETGAAVRERWAGHGWLWVESARTEPIRWSVPLPPSNECRP
jgi:hypothetical protein